MKKISTKILLFALALVSLQACGPSEEEQRAAEQARIDSLRQVEQARLAELEEAREDSLARVAEMERKEANTINFAEDGRYVVQLGAWRSEVKAKHFVDLWSGRDYPNVYVKRSGVEETGNIWFRVRVGFFENQQEAEKLGAKLAEEVNTEYWISQVERSS